jgi:DNA ligase (NAD+)
MDINKLSKAYYEGDPLVSDEEFDSYEGTNILIGYEDEGNIIPHLKFMPSLDKEKGFERITSLGSSCQAEFKYDGLSVELVYERKDDGLLWFTKAVSRGNGFHGKNITDNVKQVLKADWFHLSADLSSVLDSPLGVYCEAVINRSSMYQNGMCLDNLRNATAGVIMAKEPNLEVLRLVDLLVFDFNNYHNGKYLNQLFDYLTTSQPVPRITKPFLPSEAKAKEVFDSYAQLRDKVDYETDGVVFKSCYYRDREYQVGKNPTWAFAVKWQDKVYDTEVVAISVQVGKSGRLAPTAAIVPVVTDSGATLSYVSLHNISWMIENQCGVGSKIELVRSGDVIPKVAKVISPGVIISYTHCPRCYEPLSRDGRDYVCENSSCIGRLESRLTHLFSAQGLDVKGIGEKTVKEYLSHYTQRDEPTMITIVERMYRNQLSPLMTFLEKGDVSLDKFLLSLGIDNISKRTIMNVSSHLSQAKDIRDAFNILANTTTADQALSALKYYFDYQSDIHFLYDFFHVKTYEMDNKPQPLKGLTIVITGSCSVPREALEQMSRTYGARVTTMTSKQTSFVVVGENPGRAKTELATKYNIPTITEQEFYNFILSRNSLLSEPS